MRRSSLILLGAVALLAGSCSSPAATGGPSPVPAESARPETPSPAAPSPSALASVAVTCSVTEETGAVTVAIKDFLYDPDIVEVEAGETVTFTNHDTAPHNATLDDESCATKGLLKDWSEGLTLTEPGRYGYFCSVHPEMKATIEVR